MPMITQVVVYMAACVSTANCIMLAYLLVTLCRRNVELRKQAGILGAIVDLLVAFYPDHAPDAESRRAQAINIQTRVRELVRKT